MMTMALQTKREKPQEPTRDRILRHAITRFSSKSYESTGLREIASDAGVDVALVHRSFGSKEKLFAECVREALRPDDVLSELELDDLDCLFADVMKPRVDGEWRPIDIVVHSFSSEEAARVLREVGTEMLIAPLTKASRHGSELKIALSISILFGFTIMRDIIGADALKTADAQDLARLLCAAKNALNRDDDIAS
jgi:AcrR family transcriptional regulator